MKISEHLHALVHSLNKYETGYCLKYFRQVSGKPLPDYGKLFVAIRKQPTYDQVVLKEQFSEGKSAGHFAVLKKQAYRQTLEALARFHFSRSEFAQTFEGMRKVELLYHRGLNEQASHILKRLKRKVRQDGNESGFLMLLKWEQRLIKSLRHPYADAEYLAGINAEEKAALNILQEEQRQWEGLWKVEHLAETRGSYPTAPARAQLADWKASYSGKLPEMASRRARIDHYRGMVSYYYLHDQEQLRPHTEALMAQYAARPERLKWEWAPYFSAMTMLIFTEIQQRDFVRALELLQRAIGIFPDLSHVAGHLVRKASYTFMNLELRCYAGLGQFEAGLRRLSAFPKAMRHYTNRYLESGQISILSNMAWIYMEAGRSKDALYWLQVALGRPRKGAGFHYAHKAQIMQLVLHYELGNFELLGRLVTAFERFIRGRRAPSMYDQQLIDFFGAVHQDASPAGRDAAIAAFWARDAYIEAHGDETDGHGQSYFPVNHWLRAQQAGESLATYLQGLHPQPTQELLADLRAIAYPEP